MPAIVVDFFFALGTAEPSVLRKNSESCLELRSRFNYFLSFSEF